MKIKLGFFYDAWKAIADWIKGESSDKPKVEVDGGTIQVSNWPTTQQVAGEIEVTNRLAGNSAEVVSVQHAELAGTVTTHSLADGASELEVYLESGYIRIRTDGQPATATTGEPLGEGFGARWAVDSISVYCVEDSVFTVVSRQ